MAGTEVVSTMHPCDKYVMDWLKRSDASWDVK